MANLRIKLHRRRRATDPDEAPDLGSRLLGTVFFGMFFGIGALFVVMILRESAERLDTYRWAERRCEITQSQVVRRGGEQPYAPRVGFRTIDEGPRAIGQRIDLSEPTKASWGAAHRALAPYPEGASVPCYVSPSGTAVLKQGPVAFTAWLLLPLIFVAIGGVGLVATWMPVRRDAQGRTRVEPLVRSGDQARRGRGLVWAGAVCLAIGLPVGWYFAIKPFSQMLEARDWSSERCTVEHSSVVSISSDDGTTYRVDILYRWDRGRGVEYSSRYSFFGGSSSGYAGKKEIVGRYPVGAEVDCFIDPVQTNEAVLVRGLTGHALIALVPLALVVLGAGLVHYGRLRAARRARMQMQLERGQSGFSPDDPILDILPPVDLSRGSVVLESKSSRWTRLAGVTFAALFWNGIIGVFANVAWKSHERGRPEWFLTIFLVPFVLVGVGLVFGIIHALLAVGNARPRVIASTRAPKLGERVNLEWQFEGRTAPLERVRLTLRGREEATYQVGTDTRTSSETFYEETLAEIPTPACGLGGHTTFRIPDEAMHSFESEHNKIIWELELEGEIRRWPDVKETYPLVVFPHAPHDLKRVEEA